MAITIMQGDSYPILLELKQDGKVLDQTMISDLEVCVGEALRFTYSEQTLAYDNVRKQWYFWPTQEETLELPVGSYDVYVRIKYPNNPAQVFGYKLGKVKVRDTLSEEVL